MSSWDWDYHTIQEKHVIFCQRSWTLAAGVMAACAMTWAVTMWPVETIAAGRQVDTIEFEVDLELGSPDTSDEYIFGDITSVVEDSQGRVYVADMGQQSILKFSKEGAFVGSLGAVGDGPGDLMPFPTLGIDREDRIFIAGKGGRVEIVDTRFRHLASFTRANPTGIARSIGVFGSGQVAICATNMATHTTIDLYDADYAYLRSFSDTFAKGKSIPWQVESTYAGGELAMMAPDVLVYAQIAPYNLRKFDVTGVRVGETNEGGDGFVPEPPRPARDGDRVTLDVPAVTTGVATISGGEVMVSAHSRSDERGPHTLLCVYDRDLKLVAQREMVKQLSFCNFPAAIIPSPC
jgi:hypothetical protein